MIIEFSDKTKTTNKKQLEFIYFKDKINMLKKEGKTIYDFSIGDPTSKKDPIVLENIEQAVKKYENAGYPKYGGEEEFLIAISNYMKTRFNIDFNYKTEICVTNGVKTALDYFSQITINNRDISICPTPSYPPYINNTKDYGGEVVLLPLLEENNFLMDFEKISKDILKKTKVIFINYPNSPTGAIANLDYYKKLTKWAEENNIIIASDEGSYIDIYYDEKPISIFNGKNTKDGLIAFYSLSKRNNMINDRVGFVCGDKAIIEKYKQLQNRKMGGVPPYIQYVASLAIQNEDYNKTINEEYKKKFDLITTAFNSIGIKCEPSKGTFYLWLKAPNKMTGAEFSQKLLEVGIAVIDGSLLSENVNGIDPAIDYVRIALVPSIEDIEKACYIIKNKLKL